MFHCLTMPRSNSDCSAGRPAASEWQELRETVLGRDEYRCTNCGSESELEVHHVVPVHQGGANYPSNLVTLCGDCHLKAHGKHENHVQNESTGKNVRWVPTVENVQELVQNELHPLNRAVILTMAKIGIGLGELCNLNISDYVSRSSEVKREYALVEPTWAINERRCLRIRVSGVLPFRTRRERTSSTVVPIDAETAHSLKRWLAIRPDTPGDSEPLFTGVKSNWGARITPNTVRSIIDGSEELGSVPDGESMTPYSLRVFFSERFRGQPLVRDYILGRTNLPSGWSLEEIDQHYRRTVFDLR